MRRVSMKRIYTIAAATALLALGALAQDEVKKKIEMQAELERLVAASKIVAAGGGVMGRAVKGAPYSGIEVNEFKQILGDGTRIQNETRAQVYRDGEGRVRREVGDQVTIWDPVARVNITLNTKNMTAVKSPMPPVEFQFFEKKLSESRASASAGG